VRKATRAERSGWLRHAEFVVQKLVRVITEHRVELISGFTGDPHHRGAAGASTFCPLKLLKPSAHGILNNELGD
jgi:hypothetical protein